MSDRNKHYSIWANRTKSGCWLIPDAGGRTDAEPLDKPLPTIEAREQEFQPGGEGGGGR